MDDALLVCRFERLADLPSDRQGLIDGNRSARDPIGERLAFDEFEYERMGLTTSSNP